MLFYLVPEGFSDLINKNKYNSIWKNNWDLETYKKSYKRFNLYRLNACSDGGSKSDILLKLPF